jgi:hypothetical protein
MTIITSIQRHEAVFTISDIMLSAPEATVSAEVTLPLAGQDLFIRETKAKHSHGISYRVVQRRRVGLWGKAPLPFGLDPSSLPAF